MECPSPSSPKMLSLGNLSPVLGMALGGRDGLFECLRERRAFGQYGRAKLIHTEIYTPRFACLFIGNCNSTTALDNFAKTKSV